MPSEVFYVAEKFMREPTKILVKTEEIALAEIKQFYVNVEREEWKLDTLCDLYETLDVTKAVIFANSRKTVQWLSQKMDERDFTVSAMVSVYSKTFASGAKHVVNYAIEYFK